MPRYHFNLVDHKVIEDTDGHVLADDVEASDVANELARRLYASEPEMCDQGYAILVLNDDGSEIYRAAIRPKIDA